MTPYTRVLCPVDFTGESRRALRYAASVARWYGARLVVLHSFAEVRRADIVPSLVAAGAFPAPPDHDRAQVAQLLERLVREEVPPGIPVDIRLDEDRDAVRDIAREAGAADGSLIVMGSHARTGVDRLLERSVAERVSRDASCPVLLVPLHAKRAVPPGDVAFRRLVCAIDFSECSLEAVSSALLLAEDADAHLTLMHVAADAPTAASQRHLRQLVPESATRYCHVETEVRTGRPSHEILRVAAEQSSDLIVMGTGGHGPVARALFGSTTREVLQGATCPVLIVHCR